MQGKQASVEALGVRPTPSNPDSGGTAKEEERWERGCLADLKLCPNDLEEGKKSLLGAGKSTRGGQLPGGSLRTWAGKCDGVLESHGIEWSRRTTGEW